MAHEFSNEHQVVAAPHKGGAEGVPEDVPSRPIFIALTLLRWTSPSKRGLAAGYDAHPRVARALGARKSAGARDSQLANRRLGRVVRLFGTDGFPFEKRSFPDTPRQRGVSAGDGWNASGVRTIDKLKSVCGHFEYRRPRDDRRVDTSDTAGIRVAGLAKGKPPPPAADHRALLWT